MIATETGDLEKVDSLDPLKLIFLVVPWVVTSEVVWPPMIGKLLN